MSVGREFARLRALRVFDRAPFVQKHELWQVALYARTHGLTVEEAIRRLRKAGLWI